MRLNNRPAHKRSIVISVRFALCVFFVFSLVSCGRSDDLNRNMNQREFIIYADLVTEDLPESSHILMTNTDLQGEKLPITRFIFTADDISRAVGMAQILELNHNSRILYIRFQIHSLSGNCSLIPVLMSVSGKTTNYVLDKQLHINDSGWKEFILTLHDFTDTRSRMHRDMDAFYPGDWESIKLCLIPYTDTEKDLVIEWGPVEAVYQNHRYRF